MADRPSSELPHAVFLVVGASDEQLLRLGLWVVTAASVGERVDVLLCAQALRRLAEGAFDRVTPDVQALALPPPAELLAQARLLAPVQVVTCDTELRLSGVAPDALGDRIDAVVSLPSFWRETRGARTVTL